MKSIFVSIASMLLMVLLFYIFVFKYVVPNAAKLSIPYTWRNMPMMQDTSIVHAYLGDPNFLAHDRGLDESWSKGTKDQQYQLHIHYSETSKLAVSYRIDYHFEKWNIKKDYVLEAKDNQQ
jgi:hypothetical protein